MSREAGATGGRARPRIGKWGAFTLLMILALALNASIYIKVSLYGP
jgi:hypothetical protein